MNPNHGHNLQSPLVIFSTDNKHKHKHEFAVSIDEEAPPSEDVVDQKVAAERAKAISEVSQIRDVLSSLGYKPDHEAVDAARVSLSQIESKLSEELDEIFMQSCPEGTEPDNWRSLQEEKEQLARKAAEREKLPFKAVVRVYEMHEEYENLLKEAEHRLSTLSVSKPVNCQISRNSEDLDDEVDEEVVRILQKSNQTDLDTVDLKGRMLRDIPEAIGRLSTLKVLDLSGNRLETLPDSIAGLTSLEKLFLSANVLVSLPDSIGLLIHLQILNVSANRLKALPDSLSQCRALLELDASFNELTFLPTRLGFELTSLEKLDVHLNKLSYLPSSICEMRSLRVLDARVNELRSLPLAIGKLQNLEILNVSSNFSDLTSIPESICDLTKLVEIDLSNNQIKELPLRFGRLTNLKKINLDQNPLVIPPQDVVARGSESIKDYMAKRYLDSLLEEEQKSTMEIDETETDQSWVQRGSQTMGKWFSVVTGSLSEYLGTNKKSSDDDFLNQQY